MSLRCPECEAPRTEVKDTRPVESVVVRRRVCPECGSRFQTKEVVLSNDEERDLTSWAMRQQKDNADRQRMTINPSRQGRQTRPTEPVNPMDVLADASVVERGRTLQAGNRPYTLGERLRAKREQERRDQGHG